VIVVEANTGREKTVLFVDGPIQGAGLRFPCPNPDQGFNQIFVIDGNGDEFVTGPASTSCVGYRFVSFYFERQDGLPDDCGDPPPEIPDPPPPGWNGPTTINITYNNNDGIDVTVPIGFVFGYADIDINGQLEIPITLNTDVTGNFNFDTNIDGRIEFSNNGDINFNFGGRDFDFRPPPGWRPDDVIEGPPPPPGTSPEPPPPPGSGPPPPGSEPPPPADGVDDEIPPPPDPDVPPPDEEIPPPDEYEVIIGVRVIVTSFQGSPITRLQQGSNPDVQIPDLGLVQFLIRTGQINAGWSEDIRVKNVNQVIPCPWPKGAIDVRGTPRGGVTWELRPIYDKRVRKPEFPVVITN
jgi:hypothetical protein